MKKLKLALVLAVVALMAGGLYGWWRYDAIYPSTDDAYLEAHIVTVAPRISGTVGKVAVKENQHVKKGDVLFRLDEDQLRQALKSAEADLAVARQDARSADAQVGAAQAQLTQAEAALANAEQIYHRTKTLVGTGNTTAQQLDTATAARDEARGKKLAAEAALASAKAQAGPAGQTNPKVLAAEAAVDQAKINLGYATVSAPASGWIANLSLRPGQVVGTGQQLFSLVEDSHWWVKANFKETDLVHIKPGQPVSISVDMYPDTSLKGRVESISAGSGSTFSILPPENATGNWVKVTQRFPVRIAIDALPKSDTMPLRVGASTTVTVDTTAKLGPQEKQAENP